MEDLFERILRWVSSVAILSSIFAPLVRGVMKLYRVEEGRKWKSILVAIAISVAVTLPGYRLIRNVHIGWFGNTYYVAPDGSADNPGTFAEPWSLAKANTTLSAGDTCYLRGGTYTISSGSAINPSNTGTNGNIITYSSYNGEDVEFTCTGLNCVAINLNSDYGTVRSYIKVYGLNFTKYMLHLWILKGSHNEISHCTFIGHPDAATDSDIQGNWSASYIYRQAEYNWVHDCTFGLWGGNDTYGHDYGVVFQCGLETSATDATRYNLIENCTFYAGGHHVISFNGTNNVYRNIYAHNEPWAPIGAPVYSTRTMFQTGSSDDGQYNLVDQCVIGYGGPKNKDEIGGAGGTMASANNIWRRNRFVRIYTDGLYVTKYTGQNNVVGNHVYNNTFWHGGYGDAQHGIPNWDNRYTHGIVVEEGELGTSIHDNVFKNNIFYQNNNLCGTQYSIITRYYDAELGWVTKVPDHQIISSNWLDSNGDPKFVSIAGDPDPMFRDQYDLRLQADSPCIDAGEFLTTITSESGSGSAFTVDDAGYFFYPWGDMATEIPEATLSGDAIQLEGQSQTYTVTSINYETNEVTINGTANWTQGQGVALVYSGSSPDLGYAEYDQGDGGGGEGDDEPSAPVHRPVMMTR
jgi:hypothetical protein